MKPVGYSLPMLLVISMFCSVVAAQESATASSSTTVPRLVNFSGKTTDAQGKTISGIAGATFAIYKDQSEGSPLWLETQNVQADNKGNYTAQLGATKPEGLPLDLFSSGEARWLGVTVNGGQEQPRILLLSVPYALKAADAETIGGLPASAFARAAAPASGNATLVGAAPAQGTVTSVGLSAPASDFLVTGSPVRTKGTLGLNWNVAPTSSSTGNAIVKRDGNGNFWANYIGVSFIAAASTLGGSPVVSALDNNATGNGNGGVYGYSYGKIGVLGGCSGSQGCSGVYGDAPSLNGAFGFGVQGTSTLGPGIAGFNNSIGSVASSLLGTAPIGVIGDSNGYGVVATSDLSNALVAETGSGTTSDTVVINNLGGGFPLYAAGTGGSMYLDGAGNLHVSGQIFGSVKNFEIDHPLDPANRYLVHASVESSEMKNIYDGIVVLDSNGSATVKLPDWFEAVNGDFRYQLTAIGVPAPNLYVAHEIANGQFAIAGGQPGMKVSWQLTGVRHDPFANAHPLRVSVDKAVSERGYYVHPEFYGAPEAKSIDSAHRAENVKRIKERQAAPPTTAGSLAKP